MADGLIYPYEPGKHGIPPEELRLGKAQFYPFMSGSKRWLYLLRMPDLLSIGNSTNAEAENRYYLSAYVDSGELMFSLRTRDQFRNPYPDLYAGKFIEAAVTQIFKGKFEVIRANWDSSEISDNLQIYRHLTMRGLTKTEAANNTWTGRILNNLGYQVRQSSDVQEHSKQTTDVQRLDKVIAYFRP